MPLNCKDISRSASHTLAFMARSGSRGAATSSAASASTEMGMDFADKGKPPYQLGVAFGKRSARL
ncbi:hypothetical protein J31TS3_47360 [Paenibacillus lactis]|nr:hypothetical protein J31TS3_47360 [Paenibacillus lactis]